MSAHHVEHCMGTVFSIDVRDAGPWDDAIAEVVAWLHHVDAVFSTYQDGSDISRIRRGELAAADADPGVLPVLALGTEIEAETGGWFSVFPGGDLDPTGLVKGWAIERASGILLDHGSRNHAVNGGGDVQLAGEADPGHPWTVGVADPHDRSHVLTTLTGRDFAIATSGTAERGAHIVDPRTGAPAGALASVTVVGRWLSRVDAYATAAFARGAGARDWIEGVGGYEAVLVGLDGETTVTSGFATPDRTPAA